MLFIRTTLVMAMAAGLVGCGNSTNHSAGSGDLGGPVDTGPSGCGLFTADDPWNADVSTKPVQASYTSTIHTLLGSVNIHPDFGPGFGIPITVVPADQRAVSVVFDVYADESDPGPYPFPGPSMARVEGTDNPTSCDGDCHLLVVQKESCQLYEGYGCQYENDGWHCANGAHWDLTKKSTGQRPDGWTSADAAGLSIYAGLARYDEVMAGEITHAIRYTLPCTDASHVAPATHDAGNCPNDKTGPPMGTRVRLKASYDISSFGPVAQVFLRAFKKHGLILADNGGSKSTFFFQSEDNADWPDEINDLKQVPVSAFEALQP